MPVSNYFFEPKLPTDNGSNADDDYALAVLSSLLPESITSSLVASVPNVSQFLKERAFTNPWTVWNSDASAISSIDGGEIRGFVQARNASGEWAGTFQFSFLLYTTGQM